MTWAVTLDFHNTIATCDEWFQIEVYDLIPAFFAWRASTAGIEAPRGIVQTGQRRYRELRKKVMDSGNELDAAECIATVLDGLELGVADDEVERALDAIFRPTLTTATPVNGIIESVRQLKAAGVPLVVVSSAAFHPFLEWTLGKFGIYDCFAAVLTSASTGYYKSTPRIYEAALEFLEVQPERCIHVGDSERFDVRPASAIGMNTVLYCSDPASDCPRSQADLCLDSLSGLPQRLQTRFGMPFEI